MIDEAHHWQSTKALSVYNVLVVAKTNALPLAHVLGVLQANFLPRYDAEDVMRGVQFLLDRGLVTVEADVLAAKHSAGPGRPVRLKRVSDDSDLQLDP
jgi:hypothetical protein